MSSTDLADDCRPNPYFGWGFRMKLSVFDFDGTLFRSPHPPFWSRGTSWWNDIHSLNPPVVPLKPDSDWWIGNVVSAAKKEMANADSYVILLTGRKEKQFMFRIHELLRGAGLTDFDATYGSYNDDMLFKIKLMDMILMSKPYIDTVELWDDTEDLLNKYVSHLKNKGYEVIPHLIKSTPMSNEYGSDDLHAPQTRKWVYSGVVLDDKSHDKLKSWWLDNIGGLYSTMHCDHMTIEFGKSEIDPRLIGKKVSLKVNGYAQNKKVQAVSVLTDIQVKSGYPHITVSTIGSGAKNSSDLVKSATPVDGPVLSGVVGVSDGKSFFFKLEDAYTSKLAGLMIRYASSIEHNKQIAMMKFLSDVASKMGASNHIYVVGGAVRDFVLKKPIKDVDVVVDSVKSGITSLDFAKEIGKWVVDYNLVPENNYGVSIITIKSDFIYDGQNLKGETLEIANARNESYSGGYKPSSVEKSTIEEDVKRREFTFNTLMWNLSDLVSGPEKAEIIDITGCGLNDLKSGIMACPSGPDKTFEDDPTRMLRAIKFIGRYGFKIPEDMKKSIIKNSMLIATEVPHNAVSKIVISDILKKPYALKVLPIMKEVGLLEPIKYLYENEKSFKEALNNFFKDYKYSKVTRELSRYGVVSSQFAFVPDDLSSIFYDNLDLMNDEDAEKYIKSVKSPSIDNESIILKYKLPPSKRGIIKSLAKEFVIKNPKSRDDRKLITEYVDKKIDLFNQ